MIVRNSDRDSVLGTAIEVAGTATGRARGLLGRDCLADGEGLLFKRCASLHTFFMRFPIDVVYADRNGRVLKLANALPPFRICAAPLRAFYALELPAGSIAASHTRLHDHLHFMDETDPAVELPIEASTG